MAMPLRVEYPGAYYHIMNRGNAGENIFIESVCDEFGYSEEQAKMSIILGGVILQILGKFGGHNI